MNITSSVSATSMSSLKAGTFNDNQASISLSESAIRSCGEVITDGLSKAWESTINSDALKACILLAAISLTIFNPILALATVAGLALLTIYSVYSTKEIAPLRVRVVDNDEEHSLLVDNDEEHSLAGDDDVVSTQEKDLEYLKDDYYA